MFSNITITVLFLTTLVVMVTCDTALSNTANGPNGICHQRTKATLDIISFSTIEDFKCRAEIKTEVKDRLQNTKLEDCCSDLKTIVLPTLTECTDVLKTSHADTICNSLTNLDNVCYQTAKSAIDQIPDDGKMCREQLLQSFSGNSLVNIELNECCSKYNNNIVPLVSHCTDAQEKTIADTFCPFSTTSPTTTTATAPKGKKDNVCYQKAKPAVDRISVPICKAQFVQILETNFPDTVLDNCCSKFKSEVLSTMFDNNCGADAAVYHKDVSDTLCSGSSLGRLLGMSVILLCSAMHALYRI